MPLRSHRSRRRLATALALALVASLVAPTVALAKCPKTSLAEIDDEVMCPICGTPLGAAGGPQAEDQREFIRERVEQCQSKEQIKAALVAEYGDEVLALPKRDGFNAVIYVVPAVAFALAAALLALAARRWRRRPLAAGEAQPDGAAVDAARLAADMDNYEL
jgi:cytochrome c-type biogenesis protein CcmH/NrfF